jgi:hypothetical protein
MLPEEKKEVKKVTSLPEGQSPKTSAKSITLNSNDGKNESTPEQKGAKKL